MIAVSLLLLRLNVNTRDATTKDAAAIAAFVSDLATEHIADTLDDGGLDILLASMNADSTRQRIVDGWPHICALDSETIAGLVVIKPPTHLYHLFVRTDLHRLVELDAT